MASILWTAQAGPWLDRCVIDATPDGIRLSGTSLGTVAAAPIEIRYSILLDSGWRTLTVGADIQSAEPRRSMALSADGTGNWWMGDAPLLDFFGAIDIELAWTPATTSIPVRRLALAVGESAEIVAARVAFPEHEIARVTRRYTRTTESSYLCESAGSDVELTVDDRGLVVDHSGGWTAVARS